MIKIQKKLIYSLILIVLFLAVTSGSRSFNDSAIIDNKIYTLLENQAEVSVIVMLKNDEELHNRKFGSINEKQQTLINSNLQIQSKILGSLEKTEFRLERQFSLENAFYGKINSKGLNILRNNPKIEKIYVPRKIYPATDTSVSQINVKEDVWNLGITGQNQVVCVVDTGVKYTHPNLGSCTRTSNINDGNCSKIIGGMDFGIPTDLDPYDEDGHGTNVAGIIASTNSGYKGVAYDSRLVAVKVFSDDGAGNEIMLRDGIKWCRDNATKFNISIIQISVSIDGPNSGICSGLAETQINTANEENITIVVASGNDGYLTGINSPACASGAISVGATYDSNLGQEPDSNEGGLSNPTYRQIYDNTFANCSDSNAQTDNITCFTNRYSNLDLLAPGAQITAPAGGSYWRGTSQAAPHVAGAAALLQQFNKQTYGIALTPNQILNTLNTTGVPIFDSSTNLTFSRIDVAAAIAYLTAHNVGEEITGEVRQGQTWQTNLTINGSQPVAIKTFVKWKSPDILNFSIKGPSYSFSTTSTSFYVNHTATLSPGIYTIKIYGKTISNSLGFAEFKIKTTMDPGAPSDGGTGSGPGGINFTQASLNYISTCNPESGLEVVMKGTEANISKGDSIINITNATIQATDAFLTGLIIPDYKMWITMDTKPGNGFAGLVGDVSRVDDLYSVQFFKCKGYPEFIFFIVKKYKKGEEG